MDRARKRRLAGKRRAAGRAERRRGARRPSPRGRALRRARRARERAAKRRVKEAVRPWIPRGKDVRVRLATRQLEVSEDNLLADRIPLEVVVSPKDSRGAPLWKRVFSRLRPSINRRFFVTVERSGYARIQAEMPNTLQARAFRTVSRFVPFRELAVDLVKSKKVRRGAATAGLSAAAWALSPKLSVAGMLIAANMVRKGLKRRADARSRAFEVSVGWFERQAADGRPPTLSQAYRYYRQSLRRSRPGTVPIPFNRFVERLMLREEGPI